MADGRPSPVQERSIRGQVPNDVEQLLISLKKAAAVQRGQLDETNAQLTRMAGSLATLTSSLTEQIRRINDLERRVSALGG